MSKPDKDKTTISLTDGHWGKNTNKNKQEIQIEFAYKIFCKIYSIWHTRIVEH